MNSKNLKFLADESCDFIVVRSLRKIGYDVVAVSETFPSSIDQQVLEYAADEERILLTEDKDFGEWVFAHQEKMHGVVLIRYPASIRSELADAIISLIENHGFELIKSFTVVEPGRARIRKIV